MSQPERSAFLVVVSDGASNNYTHGLPNTQEVPSIVYLSYLDAKKGLMDIISKLNGFVPVAYGEAYPYDNTSFEKELSKDGYATIGWISLEDEDVDDSPDRMAIGLLKVPIYSSN